MRYVKSEQVIIHTMEFSEFDLQVLRNMSDYCLRHDVYGSVAQEFLNKTTGLNYHD